MNITNEEVTTYIHDHYQPITPQLDQLRTMGEKGNIPIILKETELFLNTLIALKKPIKILEIGTAIGYSAAYFATICENAQIFTVEKDEYAFTAAKQNIEAMGYQERVHCFLGDGQEQIEKLCDKKINNFDLVFIDAAKSHYRRFLDAALMVCAEGALIISDNVLQRGTTVSDDYDPKGKHKTSITKMRDYVDYICRDADFQTSLFSVGDGLAVSIYRG